MYHLEYVDGKGPLDEQIVQDGNRRASPQCASSAASPLDPAIAFIDSSLACTHPLNVGVKVVIDSKALMSIIGSEMDYVESELSSQFTFKNPNVKESCGCGLSFMT